MSIKILAIDTCGLSYSIALLEDANLIYSHSCDIPYMQCANLVSDIENLLGNANLTYKDIELIAVTTGPGSFSGVRIGSSAAYGISMGQNIPLFGVSTLDMMLYKFLYTSTKKKEVVVIYDAGKNKFFAKEYTAKTTMENFPSLQNISMQLIELTLEELEDKQKDEWQKYDIVQFNTNTLNEVIPGISNAYAVGLSAFHNYSADDMMGKLPIFYGRGASIHMKNYPQS